MPKVGHVDDKLAGKLGDKFMQSVGLNISKAFGRLQPTLAEV